MPITLTFITVMLMMIHGVSLWWLIAFGVAIIADAILGLQGY